MPVFKDEARGTWYVMVRYQDWTGERKQKCKRGFATKREAQEWERSFQMGRQENVRADHAALAGVVAVFAVILAIQSLPGTVGGRSNSGLSCASLSLRDAQMK